MTLGTIGAFIDWFPDPQGGVHIQALLGHGLLTVNYGGDVARQTASGFGFLVGFGYQGWVSDSVAIGGLFAVQGGLLTDDELDDGWDHTVLAPGLQLTGTYN